MWSMLETVFLKWVFKALTFTFMFGVSALALRLEVCASSWVFTL